MARNGITFGIMKRDGQPLVHCRCAGGQWTIFPRSSAADAASDILRQRHHRAAGLGGSLLPPSSISSATDPQDAIANTRAMGHITLGRNGALTLPEMNFSGTPAGIDVRKVVDTGILPVINTGIAHREQGIGQIGAGITHAPLGCFAEAVTALAAALPNQ